MTNHKPTKVVAEHIFHGGDTTVITVVEYETGAIMIKQDRDMVYMDPQQIAAFTAFAKAKA